MFNVFFSLVTGLMATCTAKAAGSSERMSSHGIIEATVSLKQSLDAFSPDRTYTGDATNYGDDHMGGACDVRGMPDASYMFGTAIGASVWLGGRACGACIEVDPSLAGTEGKKIMLYVSNVCPECGTGLDFENKAFIAMTGHVGGRQKIGWRFVKCPRFSSNIQVSNIGNPNDIRLNFRNMRSNIVAAWVWSASDSQWFELRKTATDQWTLQGASPEQQGRVMQQSSLVLYLTNGDGRSITIRNIKTSEIGTWQNTTTQY